MSKLTKMFMRRISCVMLFLMSFSAGNVYAKSSTAEEVIDIDDVGDEDIEDDEISNDEEILCNDPYEQFNKTMFVFNKNIEKAFSKLFKSKTKLGIIKQGLSNFAQNFFEVPRFINYTLQGNGDDAIKTMGRYVINACLGFFGLIDVAEKIGFKKRRTTFNDTLKKWKVSSGPFVVLPFLGPTSMRGAVSQAVHLSLDTTALMPINVMNTIAKESIYWTAWLFDALNTRSAYADFLGNITAMSKDEYKTVRNLVMAIEKQ